MTFARSFDSYRAALLEELGGGGPENLVLLESVESTNLLARRIAEDYWREGLEPPPATLVALEQTGGRGRLGRVWASPRGAGVYATLLVALPARGPLALLPLSVGVALARTLNGHLGGSRCRLKWPNDLLVDGRKIGGILIEAQSGDEGRSLAIVGFGVNHAVLRGEVALPREATSLGRESDDPPSLESFTGELLVAVTEEIESLSEPEGLVERYRELSIHEPGDRLRCRVGEEEVVGTFRGFDERGFLRLDEGGRERMITAGEVLEHDARG